MVYKWTRGTKSLWVLYSPVALCKIIYLRSSLVLCTNALLVVPRRLLSASLSSMASTISPTSSTLPSMSQSGLPAKPALASLLPPLLHSAPCSVSFLMILQHTIVPVASARAHGPLAIHHEQGIRSIQANMAITISSSRVIVRNNIMSRLQVEIGQVLLVVLSG